MSAITMLPLRAVPSTLELAPGQSLQLLVLSPTTPLAKVAAQFRLQVLVQSNSRMGAL
jgi:hypothetical protein